MNRLNVSSMFTITETKKVTIGVAVFVLLYITSAIVVGEMPQQLGSIMLLNGVQSAALFVLLALGLSLIFGTMGVINFAHGAFFTLGAYSAWFVTSPSQMGQSYVLGIVAAVVITGIVGLLVEVVGLRRLYDKNALLQVLFTFAVALIIEGGLHELFTAEGHSLPSPDWASGAIDLGFATYPMFRLTIIVFTAILVIGIWYMLEKTNIGLIIRAGTRNPDMVRALGIDIQRMFSVVFVIGSGLAGIAGALAAPVFTIRPSMGGEILIETFVVVVIGGIGSFFGTILSGVLVGEVSTFSAFLPVLADYGSTVIFVLMALILLIRPRGLLGEVGLYED